MKLIANMKVCNAKVIVEIIVTAVVGAGALLVERPDHNDLCRKGLAYVV